MALGLFSRNKSIEVQNFIVKIINNNCPDLDALVEGPRLDRRVNLTMVVMVIPVQDKRPAVSEAFTAVTKEFSATGMAIVLDEPKAFDEVILGFRWEREMTFIRATAKHLNPLGGGFHQLGLQLTEIVPRGKYHELKCLII